jgi:hypothetical protein
MQIFFLLFVLQMLLILGGIETNRGPELPIDDELSSSFNDFSERSSIYETFSTSVSFIHLNIQSLVPKLDSQSQVIKFTRCLSMVGGSLRVLRLLPPLKLVA